MLFVILRGEPRCRVESHEEDVTKSTGMYSPDSADMNSLAEVSVAVHVSLEPAPRSGIVGSEGQGMLANSQPFPSPY